jgi:hypothetical protein
MPEEVRMSSFGIAKVYLETGGIFFVYAPEHSTRLPSALDHLSRRSALCRTPINKWQDARSCPYLELSHGRDCHQVVVMSDRNLMMDEERSAKALAAAEPSRLDAPNLQVRLSRVTYQACACKLVRSIGPLKRRCLGVCLAWKGCTAEFHWVGRPCAEARELSGQCCRTRSS